MDVAPQAPAIPNLLAWAKMVVKGPITLGPAVKCKYSILHDSYFNGHKRDYLKQQNGQWGIWNATCSCRVSEGARQSAFDVPLKMVLGLEGSCNSLQIIKRREIGKVLQNHRSKSPPSTNYQENWALVPARWITAASDKPITHNYKRGSLEYEVIFRWKSLPFRLIIIIRQFCINDVWLIGAGSFFHQRVTANYNSYTKWAVLSIMGSLLCALIIIIYLYASKCLDVWMKADDYCKFRNVYGPFSFT